MTWTSICAFVDFAPIVYLLIIQLTAIYLMTRWLVRLVVRHVKTYSVKLGYGATLLVPYFLLKLWTYRPHRKLKLWLETIFVTAVFLWLLEFKLLENENLSLVGYVQALSDAQLVSTIVTITFALCLASAVILSYVDATNDILFMKTKHRLDLNKPTFLNYVKFRFEFLFYRYLLFLLRLPKLFLNCITVVFILTLYIISDSTSLKMLIQHKIRTDWWEFTGSVYLEMWLGSFDRKPDVFIFESSRHPKDFSPEQQVMLNKFKDVLVNIFEIFFETLWQPLWEFLKPVCSIFRQICATSLNLVLSIDPNFSEALDYCAFIYEDIFIVTTIYILCQIISYSKFCLLVFLVTGIIYHTLATIDTYKKQNFITKMERELCDTRLNNPSDPMIKYWYILERRLNVLRARARIRRNLVIDAGKRVLLVLCILYSVVFILFV